MFGHIRHIVRLKRSTYEYSKDSKNSEKCRKSALAEISGISKKSSLLANFVCLRPFLESLL